MSPVPPNRECRPTSFASLVDDTKRIRAIGTIAAGCRHSTFLSCSVRGGPLIRTQRLNGGLR
jgi:hypothetical protein